MQKSFHRYLKKTFREVLDHTRPQIILFLGDLFDEGSVATNDEYSAYLRRFHHIFHTDSSIMVSLFFCLEFIK